MTVFGNLCRRFVLFLMLSYNFNNKPTERKMAKVAKVKRGVRTKPTKKWLSDEVLSMLFYILDKLNDGKPLEVFIFVFQPNAFFNFIKTVSRNLRPKFIMKN